MLWYIRTWCVQFTFCVYILGSLTHEGVHLYGVCTCPWAEHNEGNLSILEHYYIIATAVARVHDY